MAVIPPNKILFKPTIPLSGSLVSKNLGYKIIDTIGNKIRAAMPFVVSASKAVDNTSKRIVTTGAAVGAGSLFASLGLNELAKPFRPFEQATGLPQGSGLIAIIAVVVIILILVIVRR